MSVRSTKIVATLGNASNDEQTIRSIIEAGANVLRLNFSHGTHDDHAARIKIIRKIEAEGDRRLAILADLQGPKHRIGLVEEGVEIKAGAIIRLDQDPAMGDASRVCLPHADIFDALTPKTTLLVDDGKLRLRVQSIKSDYILAEVIIGGPLKSRKGVNIPDLKLPTKPLTDKDMVDLEFALSQDVDWVALSFVQQASDMIEARTHIGDRALLMAKIEKPAALEEIDDIIRASDAVMVARGDLGVELPAAKVPAIQKKLISTCRQVGKPVVVATQMLESMIASPTPTRAEASDVAGAVFDGADAVMLSAESAAGAYPVESVAMMDEIIRSAEAHIAVAPHDGPGRLQVEHSVYHAVAHAAVELAEAVEAKAIIAFTASGNTGVRIARERPNLPLIVMTPSIKAERRYALLWGAQMVGQAETAYENAISEALDHLRERGLASTSDHVVIVAGMPFGLAGTTNSVRVAQL